MMRIDSRLDEISFLTKEEILNPFIVLEQVFEKNSTCEPVVDDLWELITHAHRRNYWRNDDSPKVLYLKYINLIRLFEASFLIQKIRPNYLDHDLCDNKLSYENPYSDSNSIIINSSDRINLYKNLHPNESYYRLGGLKFHLSNLLYDGFEPTAYRYTGYIKETTHEIYAFCSKAISSLFIIYQQEKGLKMTDKDIKRLEKYADQANDINNPQFSYDETLMSLSEEEMIEFEYKPVIRYLNSIYDFPKNYNPGNVLHYFDEFIFLIESFWNYYKGLKENHTRINWEIPEEVQKEVEYIPKAKISTPLIYLIDKFEAKSLLDWRNELEEWKLNILGNEFFRKDTYKEVSNLLLCIAELIVLLEHIPKALHYLY